ncbi:hypothetical protein MAR_019951 [Mya arenaria]|uniref:Uncharacterized protein n=1 Tax=Mya arenaria TaxID=6604 RepID=A0ABY7E3L5_MYAAR|nr:hypothetical protein MAR_019951 [Mya arenaria]
MLCDSRRAYLWNIDYGRPDRTHHGLREDVVMNLTEDVQNNLSGEAWLTERREDAQSDDHYSLSSEVAVDKAMVKYTARLSFCQYMPAKPNNRGI